jgi:hypothetical protein
MTFLRLKHGCRKMAEERMAARNPKGWGMVECPNCHQRVIQESTNFCSNCGRQLDKNAPLSDFERGRIDAINNIKQEFWNWLNLPASILAIFGLMITVSTIFGIQLFITSQVETKVQNEVRHEMGCVSVIVSLRSWIEGLGTVGRYHMHRLAEIVA